MHRFPVHAAGLIAIVAFCAWVRHAETAPLPKLEPPPGAINLSGRCQFGTIEHAGRHIRITGAWSGTGTFRDRWAMITWTSADGRVAYGAYFLNLENELEGCWGWADDGVAFDECDMVDGPVTSERFRVLLP